MFVFDQAVDWGNLPHLMAQTDHLCVIAFLDIVKTYDSLNLKLLFMAMGLGFYGF